MVRPKQKIWAFTIAEMAVVSSIMLLLLALVAMYFAQGQHYVADLSSYTTLQRETSTTLQRMLSQMENSSLRQFDYFPKVSTDSPPYYAYFLSSLPLGNGQPTIKFDPATNMVLWQQWIGYYHDPAQKKVFEVSIPLNSPTSVLTLPPSPIPSYDLLKKSNPKPVGRNITEMSIVKADDMIVTSLTGEAYSSAPLQSEEAKKITIKVSQQVYLQD